jgi:hypothetical protein
MRRGRASHHLIGVPLSAAKGSASSARIRRRDHERPMMNSAAAVKNR